MLCVYVDTQIMSIVKFFSAYFTNGVVKMFISFNCHTTNEEHNAIKKLLPLLPAAKKLLPMGTAPRSTKRNLMLGNQGEYTNHPRYKLDDSFLYSFDSSSSVLHFI
jgi:hypothetical protein